MASLNIMSIDRENIYARVGEDKSTHVYSRTTELGLNYHSGELLRFTETQWGEEVAAPFVKLKNTGPRVCYLFALNNFNTVDVDLYRKRGFEALEQFSGWPQSNDDVQRVTEYINSPGFDNAEGVRLNSYEEHEFNFGVCQFVLCFEG
ncbi:hypothetical protein [Pseudomonas alvandae]|jgi:hypothetical protein|uniref:hypothetical protein n=1 Tax=Pseudomonas canavaninivorans TaxID=2842348 RepID=UPI002FF027A4